MKTALALLALLGAASLELNTAKASPDQSLPQAINDSITEQNVGTAISELKKDAANLKARLKELEASLAQEPKDSKYSAKAKSAAAPQDAE